MRTFFKRTGQPLNQPWLVALVAGLVKRFPLFFLMRLGTGAVFRPRTWGWGRTGRAIQDYANEADARNRAALGLTGKGDH